MPETAYEPADFVEEMGLFFEGSGIPRMAGRILGWLLICDPPHQSAAELREALGASKGSISMMTRLLIQLGVVERLARPGRREAFYRVRPGVWSELLERQLGRVSAARELAERGLALVSGNGDGDSIRRRLEQMRDLHAFVERELPQMLERWRTRAEPGASAAPSLGRN